MKFVCADCGNEQNRMNICEKCNSPRVVLQSVAEQLFGPNWRDCFKEKKNEQSSN